MRFLKSLGYRALLIFSFIYFYSLGYSATIGKFTYISGRVDVTSPGKKAIPAKLGMGVSVGDIIRAKSNSKAEITFNDGNILRIAQNTRVQISRYMIGENNSFRMLNLFRGNIQNIVKKSWAKKIADFIKNHKYEVHTPIAVVGVKGTNFFTFHTRMGSGAIFKEGVGYCYAKKLPQKIVYVFPGQKVIITSPISIPIVKPVSKTEIQRFESQTIPEKKGTKGKGGEVKLEERKEGTGEVKKAEREGKTMAAGGEETAGPPPASLKTAVEETKKLEFLPKISISTPEGERTGQQLVNIPITEVEENTLVESKEVLDTTPPEVKITKAPNNPTNSHTARFEWESNEPSIYYYRLDNKSWFSTKETYVEISNLAEGDHTFELKAVDNSGNESDPVAYDWKTDYTPPTVKVDASSSPQSEPDKSEVKFTLTSNEPTTYQWNFDGNKGTAKGTTLTFEDIAEGTHNFSFTAEDEAGNKTNREISFKLKRYRMRESDIISKDSSYTGSAKGDISAVIDNNWGGWVLDASGDYIGPHGDFWSLISGGSIVDSQSMWRGYWIYGVDGDYKGSDMSGFSSLKVLTYLSLGEGKGYFQGSYNDSTKIWKGSDSGDYTYSSLIYSGIIEFADDWNLGPYWGLYGTNTSGGFDGINDTYSLIGGIAPPWNNAVSIYIMGEIYNKINHHLPYLWNNDIYSYDWNNNTYSTYDGGTFKGFIGGVWIPNSYIEGDIDARIVAIYRAPNGDIGYLTGSVEGSYWPDLSMLYAEGSELQPYIMGSWSEVSPEGFYNSIRTDKNMSAKIAGGFGPEGNNGFIDGINFNEGSWTRYLDGKSWGIYDLIINGYESYSNPNGDATWKGIMGGDAYFGTYIDNNGRYKPDYGYWIANLEDGIWQNSKITADIMGKFLTLTKKGSINGELLGYYDRDNTIWAATGLGVYKGNTVLTFSSYIKDGRLSAITSGILHKGIWENSSTHEIQEYEYISEGYGWGYKEVESDTITGAEYLPDHTYLKWQERGSGKPPVIIEQGSWPENFQISSLGDNPDPNDPNWSLTEGDTESNTNVLADAGSFDLILGGYIPEGGPTDLWHSIQTPASISIMGMLKIMDRFKNDYWLFYSNIRSYNPYDLTDTTPDKGAYWGWIGGIIDDVEGSLIALYIDPARNAGILEGSFSGADYRSINMFEADGYIYANPMTSDISYAPSELMDKVIQNYIFGTLYGSFGDNSEIKGSGSGRLAYIQGEFWGIYEMIFGKGNTYDNPDKNTNFTAKCGGIIPFQDRNFAYWLSDLNGTWGNNRLSGSLLGYYLSMTNKGTVSGELLGTYKDDNTWQAISLGYWEKNNDLYFASYTDADAYYFNGTSLAFIEDTEIPGAIMGGLDSIWNATSDDPARTKFMGGIEYESISKFIFRNTLNLADNRSSFVSYNVNTEDFTTLDQNPGSYSGFLGGIIDPALVIDSNNNVIKGLVTAFYVDPNRGAGVLLGDFSGTVYPGIEMWEAEGIVYPVKLSNNIGFSPSELINNITYQEYDIYLNTDQSSGVFTAGGIIQLLDDKSRHANISNELWGIWQDIIGGTFNGTTSDSWKAYAVASDNSWYVVFSGNKWSEDIIKADVSGSWVSWDQAITGVVGGKLVGTFDPSNPNWQAVAQGVKIETQQFLEMVQAGELQKLRDLNIPCYEVGRTDLTGVYSDDSTTINVNIKHVVFLAPYSGGPAKIWASAPTTNDPGGGVSGTYTGTPVPGINVPLSGQNSQNCAFPNGSVNFNIQRWQSGKWGAIINGSGVVNSANVNIKGAASGTYGTNSFSGTASGIVQNQ